MFKAKDLKADFLRLLRGERRDVALVLSSGGARGLAHVGAINALTEKGYHITSVSGTSFGSIVGAVYAAGHLDDFREWMKTIDRKRMLQLSDFSIGPAHILKGIRIIKEMQTFVPDRNIEDLPIPFTAVATDWKTGREVVFNHGSLWTAVRASISIPAFYKPLMMNKMILIDGGITNPFPLDRVKRHKGDLLVGVNVSGHDYAGMYVRRQIAEKIQRENSVAYDILRRLMPQESELGLNFYSIINQALSISINSNAHRAIKLYPPDVLVDIPMRRYNGNDYDKSEKIIKIGYQKMIKALDKFEAKK
ncbi:MAG: patatin-like phospholipase family protein [Prevotella sp.]|jgi:NTE family protein